MVRKSYSNSEIPDYLKTKYGLATSQDSSMQSEEYESAIQRIYQTEKLNSRRANFQGDRNPNVKITERTTTITHSLTETEISLSEAEPYTKFDSENRRLGTGGYGVVWPSGEEEILEGDDIEDALVKAGHDPKAKLTYYKLDDPQHKTMWEERQQYR